MRNDEALASSGAVKNRGDMARACWSSVVPRIALEWRILLSSRTDGRPCSTWNGHVLHGPPIVLKGSCVTITPQTLYAALLPSLSVGARRNQQAELNPSQNNQNHEQNGTGCVTISAFRVSAGNREHYSPLEWQPRKRRKRAGMECRRIEASSCNNQTIS